MSAGLIDLSHSLMCFVYGVDKRESDAAQGGFKLRQDGTAKRFCSDRSAIGHKENSAIGHSSLTGWVWRSHGLFCDKCAVVMQVFDKNAAPTIAIIQ
jgi:hypothetical protein